jgi:hypothetical protein
MTDETTAGLHGDPNAVDVGEVRAGLNCAAVALAATAETMDRIVEMLAKWDERASWGGPAPTDGVYQRAWSKAAEELRAAIAPMRAQVQEARQLSGEVEV